MSLIIKQQKTGEIRSFEVISLGGLVYSTQAFVHKMLFTLLVIDRLSESDVSRSVEPDIFLHICICIFVFVCCENICSGDRVAGDRRMTLRELGKRAFLVFCICAFAFFVFVFVCCENICNGDQSDQVAGDRRMTLRRRRGVLASLPSPYPVTCTNFRTLQLCFCVLCICIFVFVLYLYLCLTICILCLSPF